MVGESQGAVARRQLAVLRRPGLRARDGLEAAPEQVVDRSRARGPGQAEAALQLREDVGVLAGAQVEVAAEEQRRLAGPVDGRGSRAQDIGGGELRPAVCCVQVGDAEMGTRVDRDPREGHRPPLRPPGMDRQLTPLGDHPPPLRLFPVIGG